MSTVTGFTAERMLQIENSTVVTGTINGNGELILTTRGGQTINAGYVQGDADTRTWSTVSTLYPTPADGVGMPEGALWWVKGSNGMIAVYEWNGTAWVQNSVTGDLLAANSIGTSQLTEEINNTINDARDQAIESAAKADQAVADANAALTGVASSIKELVTEYALSDSETIAPTTGWSTSAPARTPGTYIWQRITSIAQDDSSDTSLPVLVTGNTGAPGSSGNSTTTVNVGTDAVVIPTDAAGYTTTSHVIDITFDGRVGPSRAVATAVVSGLPTGMTVTTNIGSTITGDGIITLTVASGTNLSGVRNGSISLTFTCNGQTFTRIFSWAKAVTGDPGASATSVDLGNEAATIATNAAGATTAASTITIPFTAFVGNVRVAATMAVGTLPSGVTVSSNTAGTTSTAGSLVLAVASGATLGGSAQGNITMTITANGLSFARTLSWAKAVTGAAGAPGSDGKGVSSTAVSYQVSTSGTVAPTGTWLSSPSATTTGQFLWTRTIITYTDASTSTAYGVSAHGATGSPGSAGVSVSSITPYFMLVSTGTAAPNIPTTNPPGGSWQLSEPAWVSATDLYRTELILFSNSTFAYTGNAGKAIKVSSYEAATQAITVANLADAAAKGMVKAQQTDPGHQLGRIWLQTNVSGDTIGIKVSNGSAWTSYMLAADQVLVPSSVGSTLIADGAITTPKVQANSIIAKHLFIGDFTNYASGSDFEDDLTNPWSMPTGWFISTAVAKTGSRSMYFTPHYSGANGTNRLEGKKIEVSEDDVIYAELWVRTAPGITISTTNSGNAKLRFGKPDGSIAFVVDFNSVPNNNTWVKVSNEYVVPAGVTYLEVNIATGSYISDGDTKSVVRFDDIKILKKTNGSLIVDGSITATQLNVSSIWATSAWLTAARIGVLVAGSISSEMLTVGIRLPQGNSANRVPAPFTDSDYWNKVSTNEINLNQSWTSADLVKSITADGIQIKNTAAAARPLGAMRPTQAPASGKVFVYGDAIGTTAGTWYATVRAYAGPNGTGATLSNQNVTNPAGSVITLPSGTLSYWVYLQIRASSTAARMSRFEVFEVIGSGGLNRVEISPQGVKLFDGEGNQRLSLNTLGDDVLDISKKNSAGETVSVASIDEDGNFAGNSLIISADANFQGANLIGNFATDPSNGQDLTDIPMLDRLGRGLISSALIGTATYVRVDHTRAAIASGSVELIAGRSYQFVLEGTTVTRWESSQTVNGRMSLWYSTAAHTIASPTTTNGAKIQARYMDSAWGADTAVQIQSIPFPPFVPTVSGLYYILVAFEKSSTSTNKTWSFYPAPETSNPGRISLYDIGPGTLLTYDNWSSRAYVPFSGSSSGSTTPPVASTTKTWNCTWSVLWGPSGTIRPSGSSLYDDGRMVQGGNTGSRAGQIGFPALGISGKTITGAWVRLKNRHTYSSSGATVDIGTHGNGSAPTGSAPNNANTFTKKFSKGQDQWVAIPSARWAAIAAGTIRGFQIGGPNVNSGNSDYGIFDGYSTTNAATSSGIRPQLKITYK